MAMNLTKAVRYFFIALIAMAIVMLFAPVWAGDRITQSNDNNAQTTGDVMNNIGGDDSLGVGIGLSYGMGDVDINEGQNCMGSEQKANVLWGRQELALNAWCAALFYELNGKHLFAAKMRCSIEEISMHYATDEECWSDQDLTPPPTPEPTAEEVEAEEEFHEEQQEQLIDLQSRLQALEEEEERERRVIAQVQEAQRQEEQRQREEPPATQFALAPEQRAAIAEVLAQIPQEEEDE